MFKIIKRYRKKTDPHINLYKLADLLDEEFVGVFYENQLQKEPFDPNKKQIKEVLSKRKSGQLVSLLDYPKAHREFIPKSKK